MDDNHVKYVLESFASLTFLAFFVVFLHCSFSKDCAGTSLRLDNAACLF